MSAQRARSPQREEGWESLIFVGVLTCLGTALVVWATGQVSGWISSGRLPAVSPSDVGGIIVRLTRNLSDPAAAWPRRARSELGSPTTFYAVFVVILGLAVGVVTLGLRVLRDVLLQPAQVGSKWARLADLRALVVRSPVRGRLVLGRVDSKLVAAEAGQSIIVLGPTQSMKTTGFAIPSILEWDGPALATSVKSDLLRDTFGSRAARGGVWVYDPTGSTGYETAGWSPLDLCHSWGGAQRTSMWLAAATRSGGSGLGGDADFWYAASAKHLGPHLFAAAISGRTMSDVVRWINTQEEREVREVLLAAGVPEALEAAIASWKREPRQRSSIYTTVETILNAYEDPVVAASANGRDISAAQLLDGTARTLYVVSPSHEQRRLRPLFETLLQTVINHAFELSSHTGRPLDPPLLVVLDEAANIAPLRDLDTLASTAASHGIQLVSVFQDLAQVSTRYAERSQTVVNNHRGKIILSGISDTQTLEYASRLLGDEEVMRSSVTRGSHGSRSTTESVAMRSMAPAHVLRSIRPGEGVLVYGHLPPARLRLRPWFNETSLSRTVP